VTSYNDSAIFKHWLNKNWGGENIPPCIQSISDLQQSSSKVFLLKLPKNRHFFEYQLSQLSTLKDSTILVAGMQKHWPRSFYELAKSYFNEMEVLPGVKKAKCMVLSHGKNKTDFQNQHRVNAEEFGMQLINLPNVFSYDHLDIGTRFFLENFPTLNPQSRILDIGCGNGALGIMALIKTEGATATFLDESLSAIESCKASLAINNIDVTRAEFIHNNCLNDLNPPPI